MNYSFRRRNGIFTTAILLAAFSVAAYGQTAEDIELQTEMRYIEGLGKLNMPDYAELVLADMQRKFGSGSETKILQLEQMLRQGKFDAAVQEIARAGDSDTVPIWQMKLLLADYYYGFGKYPEALGIYNQFINKFPSGAPGELELLHREAAYKYAQMLIFLKKDKQALEAYRVLAKLKLEREIMRQVQFEMAEVLVRLAGAEPAGSGSRSAYLDEAQKICENILWVQDLWFGRGIVQLAHIYMLRNDVEGAQKLINSYMPQLVSIDEQLQEYSKSSGEDMTRLSPVAECRYLMGAMMHDEAKKLLEIKDGAEPSEEDRMKARDMLVGKKTAAGGTSTTGAYQEFINVAVQFPGSSWAPDAMMRAEEIESTLVGQRLVRAITPAIPSEKRREIAERQFQSARMLYNQQQFENAIEVYLAVLASFPEVVPDSISALSELARCYIELWNPEDPNAQVYEIYADTVVDYLADRFCRNPRALVQAGDEIRRLADSYGERKQEAKRQQTYETFFECFPLHPMAAPMLLNFAERNYAAQDFEKAMGYYEQLANSYSNSPLSIDAINRIATIYRDKGDTTNELAWLDVYVKRLEENKKPGQKMVTAVFQIAQAKRAEAAKGLRSADLEVKKASNAEIMRVIKMYAQICKMVADPDPTKYSSNADDNKRNQQLNEAALYGQAFCLSSLTLPADKLKALKQAAIAGYEKLLKAFPETEYAPASLAQIGTLWVALGETAKADEALTRLSDKYPESKEAKMALFTRGSALIELGFRAQGVEVLKQMFADAAKYPPQQMLVAGQELLKSKEYELAMQGFDVAMKAAPTNNSIQMPALLGLAEVAMAQERYADAVKLLEDFLVKYPKSVLMIDANLMLSHAASECAIPIADRNERVKMFNKAVDAMKVVRQLRTKPGEIAKTDNDIGEILLRKAEAEEKLKNEEKAIDYKRQVIAHFITVLDTADSSVQEVAPYLEQSYKTCVGLMLDTKEYEDANYYCNQYFQSFPKGRFATDMRNFQNLAAMHVDNGGDTAAPEAKPETPAAAE